jgi:hypothetical protein
MSGCSWQLMNQGLAGQLDDPGARRDRGPVADRDDALAVDHDYRVRTGAVAHAVDHALGDERDGRANRLPGDEEGCECEDRGRAHAVLRIAACAVRHHNRGRGNSWSILLA